MARPLRVLVPCLAVAVSLAAAGCIRLTARTVPPPPPPLDVPAPPPRVVEAAGTEPPPPGALVEAPDAGSPSSRRPPARAEAPKPGPSRTDPVPAPAADVPPPQEPARSQPATTLQMTPPEREAALETQIRVMLARAANNLNRVDYGRLNVDAKAQYDQAKRFATQADDSLRARNLVFALKLAENASTLAAQLAGR